MEDEDDVIDRERVAQRLKGPEAVPIFAGFMMAAMSAGRTAKVAANEADFAMAELRKRYT